MWYHVTPYVKSYALCDIGRGAVLSEQARAMDRTGGAQPCWRAGRARGVIYSTVHIWFEDVKCSCTLR
eukprot:scaffold139095_cov109-Phaeocystis_antarctica.AAC.2